MMKNNDTDEKKSEVLVIREKEDIKEEEFTQEIQNVLLLNMSTLPVNRPLERNSYEYIEKEDPVYGWGQLEPVPKMLNEKLKKDKNEKLDLILIMASDETQEEKTFEVIEGVSDAETKSVFKKGTAVSFFKEQICKENEDVRFKVFTGNNNELPKTMEEVVGFIRKIKKCNSNFKLYLDIHGGPRQAQLSVDAIISLLAMEDIQIEEAFSIAGVQNKTLPTPIINVTDDMKIFDFVSGMNEFINYGKSNGLEKFFGSSNKIVKNIRSIARAIQICDIDKFLQAVDRFRDNIEEREKMDKNEKNLNQKLLDIFIDNMKTDYGKVLRQDRTDLDLLKWCEKKEFYQQALTVIESRIPGFLDGKLYEFEIEDDSSSADDSKKQKSNLKEILKIIKKPHSWGEDSNYLLEQWGYSNVIKQKSVQQEDGRKKKENRYIKLNGKDAEQFWNQKDEYWKNGENSKYVFEIRDKSGTCSCKVKLKFLREMTEEEEKKFNIFVQLHLALKKQRNLVNHAVSGDSGREDAGNIFNAIKAYIEMVEEFTKNTR